MLLNEPVHLGENSVCKYRFIQLDVFTEEPFTGNALAVFPEAEGISDEQMMKIAREMNLSETVFVLKTTEDGGRSTAKGESPSATNPQSATSNPQSEPSPLRRLRIFTPAREIPFAGHPIVGTWNALAQLDIVPLPEGKTGWSRIHHEVGIGVLPVDIEFKNECGSNRFFPQVAERC